MAGWADQPPPITASNPVRANRFGDVGGRMGNAALSQARGLLARPYTPYKTGVGLLDYILNFGPETANLAGAGLLGMQGLTEKAVGYGSEILGGSTAREQQLANDLMGMIEVGGVNPEGRMAAALAATVPPELMAEDLGRLVGRFAADESGALTLWHGTPHTFPAERLVRMADGSQQYIVGGIDRLPDVPQGATVLQDFPLGRFRMDKIGTGEGAQAYGHGLYTAGARETGASYQTGLSDDLVNIGGVEYRIPRRSGGVSRDVTTALGLEPGVDSQEIFDAISDARFSGTNPIDEFDARAAARLDEIRADIASATGEQYRRGTQRFLAEEERRLNDLRRVMIEKNVSPFRTSGNLYQLHTDLNPEDFIDFDAPWESQPEAVKRHFAYLAKGERKPTGEDLARRVESNIYTREAAEAGIPGIRYLDAGSRGAGSGTSNYVFFNPDLLGITHRNDVPVRGLLAPLGGK